MRFRTGLGRATPAAVLALLAAGMALVACSETAPHAHTDFPVIDGAQVVADTEQPSGVTTSVGHYLILFDSSLRGTQLARAERGVVAAFGWEWHHPWKHAMGDWESSEGDYIRFGAASGRIRRFIPRRIKELIATTPGAPEHKVVVGMAPPEDY